MANYNNNSPWAKVQQSWYLDYTIPAYFTDADSDTSYTIPNTHDCQPWKLSKELYGTEELYYIFALLNPDLLQDPVYDFSTGKTIKVPEPQRVRQYLQGTRTI